MAHSKNKKSFSLPIVLIFIASATITALVSFGIAQQVIRSSANDPQRLIAQDIARKLTEGDTPQKNWLGRGKMVELSLDSRPFYIIYDKDKNIATTSAMLNGQAPNIPLGVLDAAQTKEEHLVTWQPALGVREALVVKAYKGVSQSGYVVAGKSLSRAEGIIYEIGIYIFIGWLIINAAIGIIIMFMTPHKKTGW